ncbi:hypothetical protein FH597_13980 [Leptospira interrogans]|uniref:hypothetical protein n=1 Tax=Leptospira interrogans TaxID=173 RepID=UPI001EF0B764|nr:hypothetical protein [Leptospira interrogans]ULG76284.1 hypothetical protein FH597_13980 [Leptospira interrogans]
MNETTNPDIKNEAVKSLLQPFGERFSHPILSWVIVFSVYFHIKEIAKFVLYLYDLYFPPKNMSILDDIGNEITCWSILGPIILGSIVGFLFPVFDAAFSKWVAVVQRMRENWIKNEISKVYKTNIKYLDSALRAALGIIEDSSQREIFRELDPSVQNTLKVVRGVATIESGDCVKFDNTEGIIYPCQNNNDNPYGIVIRNLNNGLFMVLQTGRIKSNQMNSKFLSDGNYSILEGSWSLNSGNAIGILKKEKDWISIEMYKNVQLDNVDKRFRSFIQ